jgi:hypothetical protein
VSKPTFLYLKGDNLALQKVLLFSSESVIDLAISNLITTDGLIQLTIAPVGDIQGLLLTSEHLQPDVIIFENNLLEIECGLLSDLLNRHEHSRIIAIDRNLNLLHIYMHRGVPVQQSSDLITLIRSQFQGLFPGSKHLA